MKKSTFRIVNAGLVGEPEHIVFQNTETLEILELDSISHTFHNELKREYNNSEDWKYVISNMNQHCEIGSDDVGDLTIYLT